MRARILKQVTLAVIGTLVGQQAIAVAPGLYLGLMMGPASSTGDTQLVQVQPLPTAANPKANTAFANPKNTLFGSRIYLGYKFNPYASFEGGFTYLSGINYTVKNSTAIPAGGTTARVKAVDFVGKIDYSYNNTFGVFAKAGVSALYLTTPGAMNVTNYHQVIVKNKTNPVTGPTSTQIFNSGSNTYSSKLAPTFTIGADYDIDQNWVIDLSWMRLLPGNAAGNIDIYALGLSYHLVDKYCGQFLCN